MAFAIIAGLAPIYGLYTAVVTVIVGALAGRSSFLSTGSTNALSLVVGSTLAPFAGDGNEAARLFTLTLLVGIFQLGMAALRLGNIVRFVSNAVMVGFITGAGLLIAIGQLSNLLEVSVPGGEDAFTTIYYTLRALPDANYTALAIGVLAAVVTLALQRTRLKLFAPLFAIVTAGVLVALLKLDGGQVRLVGDVSVITRGLPTFSLHRVRDVSALAPKALAIALLGLVQSVSIVQSLSSTTGEHPRPTREFAGQGIANTAGAFFQCMPAGGSLSRTAVNFAAGAKTRMSGVFSGAFVGLVLLLFESLAERIPMPALAGLLMVVAVGLIDRRQIDLVWRTATTSRTVFLVTFVATLVFPLEYSIYLGAMLSIANYLEASSHPQVTRLVPSGNTFREVAIPDEAPEGAPILISISGDLHFAAINDIESKLPDLAAVDRPIIILRLRRSQHLASTGINFLRSMLVLIHRHEGELILCGVTTSVIHTMRKSGLLDEMNEANVFRASPTLMESTRAALDRAREIQQLADNKSSE